jgi:hypothetical protein
MTIATTAITLIHLIPITPLHQGDMDITGSTMPLTRTTHILHHMMKMVMVECASTILTTLRLSLRETRSMMMMAMVQRLPMEAFCPRQRQKLISK